MALARCSFWLTLAGILLSGAACGKPSATPESDGGSAGAKAFVNGCVGSDCPCRDAGADQGLCDGECVSLATSSENCGACGHYCGVGQTCKQGACACSGDERMCGGVCSQVSDDAANCGACGKRCSATQLCEAGKCIANTTGCVPACSGGQRCGNGKCACPDGQTACDGRCIDTSDDAANCGACGSACGAKQLCQAGACTCAGTGMMACGKRCSELATDAENCGECGHACSTDQSCVAGSCRSVWSDGCLDGPAHDAQLVELNAYQALEIPLYKQTGAIAVEERTADVVQGRTVVFRAFVAVGAGWKARDIAARMTLQNGTTVDHYAVKQRVERTSTEPDLASTFALRVPGDKIGPDTQYAVELVDCAAASGTTTNTRMPGNGSVALSARKTGALKVTIIPVMANDRLPDTSSAALAKYRDYLEAMYPVAGVELQVGTQISTDSPLNWNTLVEQIRVQRTSDKAAPDVYYYGMVKPTNTLKEFCSMGCTAGVGYVTPITAPHTRAAVGLAYADETSASTMAHEIGHNHGRKHSLCPDGIAGVDENLKDAALGAWGFDIRSNALQDPTKVHDIMGYCEPKWVSSYNYRALVERIAQLNEPGGIMVSDTTPLAAYRVLLVDDDGPRWSVPFADPVAAYGEPELADVFDIDDQLITQILVYRTQLPETSASSILVQPPEPGWNALKVEGALPVAFSAPITVPGAK